MRVRGRSDDRQVNLNLSLTIVVVKLVTHRVLYLIVLVELILSDIYIETESQLLILHGLGRQNSLVTASMSRGGGQLIVMVQKL